MELKPVRFDAPLQEYIAQADALLAGWHSRNEKAIRVFRSRHPKFLDDTIPWLERNLTGAEVRATPIHRDDARPALARWRDVMMFLIGGVSMITWPGGSILVRLRDSSVPSRP